MFRRHSLLVIGLLLCSSAYSQEIYWPSPEVAQMYREAKEALSRGAVKQSIVLFQQASQLAPDITVVQRDLGQALNLAGDYNEAYRTVEPLLKNGQADEMTYQVAGSALLAKGEKKKAKSVLEKGIKAFPHSGLLYNELGRYYEAGNDLEYALDAWLQGIEGDPLYHMNYYNAARIYATTDKHIWTILYGELFVNLERQTNRSLEMRKIVFQAYQKLFATAGTATAPKYGGNITEGEELSFEAAVMQTYQQLSPVVSDGITTESLTMLRTRFIMAWLPAFGTKYPFTLFTYQDKMLRDGEFDAYNQWAFGKADNANQYESWTRFHPEAMPEYESWTKTNQFNPTAGDFYNSKDLRTLFVKKKKR